MALFLYSINITFFYYTVGFFYTYRKFDTFQDSVQEKSENQWKRYRSVLVVRRRYCSWRMDKGEFILTCMYTFFSPVFRVQFSFANMPRVQKYLISITSYVILA